MEYIYNNELSIKYYFLIVGYWSLASKKTKIHENGQTEEKNSLTTCNNIILYVIRHLLNNITTDYRSFTTQLAQRRCVCVCVNCKALFVLINGYGCWKNIVLSLHTFPSSTNIEFWI